MLGDSFKSRSLAFDHGRKTPPFAYVPFGGGPQSCIGAAFGQAEAQLVIARLLQTHTIEFTNHRGTLIPGRVDEIVDPTA